MTRRLIVNADDFGRSRAVNEGVVRAHEDGIVTSASLMVRGAAAAEAAASAPSRLSLGLHVDLAEWTYRDGEWQVVYERVPVDDGDAVAAEVEEQLARFRALVGRDPTHVDSHQHVHRDEPVASVLRAVAERLGVPLRHFGPIAYCGAFYGQDGRGVRYPELIGVDALVATLASLPEGVTELVCHPGVEDANDEGMYAAERARELETLCDPRVRAALAKEAIELRSFADV